MLSTSDRLNDRLMIACYGGSVEEVRRLVDEGADVCYVCASHSTTPLMQSAKRNHYLVLEYLLDCARDKFDQSFPSEQAEKHYRGYVNQSDNSGLTALSWACRADPSRPSIINFDNDGNILSTSSPNCISIDLSLKGDECARLLVEAGANINSIDENRMNALHWSAYESTIKIFRYLLELDGLNVNAVSDKGSVLNILFYLGNAALLRKVFEERASQIIDIKWKGIDYRHHPLQHISGFFHKKIPSYLNMGKLSLYDDTILRGYKNVLIRSVDKWQEGTASRPLLVAEVDAVLSITDLSLIAVDYLRIDTELNELIDEFEEKLQRFMIINNPSAV